MSRANPLPEALAGGSFTLASGLAQGQSRSRLRAKDLRTPSRGIRVPKRVAQPLHSRIRPYLELSERCVASDSTAAQLLGMPLPGHVERDPRLHLSSSASSTGPRRKHVVGHSRRLEADEIIMLEGIQVTSPARTWLDLAPVLTLEELVVAGDFLVNEHNRGFGIPKRSVVGFANLSNYILSKRRVPGLVLARKALPLLRVGVDSPQETRLRLMLRSASHLPDFQVNYPVSAHAEENPSWAAEIPRWVDLGCPEYRTCLEYEGAHHLTPLKQAADKARDLHMLECGWHQVKIYARDLELGAEWVVPQVEAALRRGGWSPPS